MEGDQLPSSRYPVLTFVSGLFKAAAIVVLVGGLLGAYFSATELRAESRFEGFATGMFVFLVGAFAAAVAAAFVAATGYLIDLALEIADHAQLTAEGASSDSES